MNWGCSQPQAGNSPVPLNPFEQSAWGAQAYAKAVAAWFAVALASAYPSLPDTGNASVQFEAIRRERLRDYGLRFCVGVAVPTLGRVA